MLDICGNEIKAGQTVVLSGDGAVLEKGEVVKITATRVKVKVGGFTSIRLPEHICIVEENPIIKNLLDTAQREIDVFYNSMNITHHSPRFTIKSDGHKVVLFVHINLDVVKACTLCEHFTNTMKDHIDKIVVNSGTPWAFDYGKPMNVGFPIHTLAIVTHIK